MQQKHWSFQKKRSWKLSHKYIILSFANKNGLYFLKFKIIAHNSFLLCLIFKLKVYRNLNQFFIILFKLYDGVKKWKDR